MKQVRLDTYETLDLSEIPGTVGAILTDGARDRRGVAHTPTVASVGADGAPAIRTVVLRDCDWPERLLRFHTDRRSPKVTDYSTNPEVAFHLYDAERKLQLRLHGQARIETAGPLFDLAWKMTQKMSRECYQMTVAPGAAVPDPGAVPYDAAGSAEGRRNFAIVLTRIERFDWLYLSASDHRRARFEWQQGQWSGGWCAP
ncbi:pyridoxamine 5'-phosphate oxidase family protein [Minwuia sp.]|uniref:pyridoxamine 5'-phosphate oxidase family protein n=1 Tax=Minwuia sp. TaxID=2493630 RepID=UPI003A8E66AC